MANRFLNNITINDEYTLPSADGTADQIITTDGSGQLSFVDQNTINAGNAEHVVIYAKNTSGASISKGTPVYITGTVGATDTVQIAPADAGNSAKMPAVGLLDATLAVNAFGYVITGGFMDNITTDPIDGATPTSNDTVYVKVGGGLTLTKPTGPTGLIQNVAKVGKVSGGNAGSLIVSSILRTNDVPNLTTGKIWVGSAANTIESATVHLDEANGRMGIGTTSPSTNLEVVTSDPGNGIKGTTNTGIIWGSFINTNSNTFPVGKITLRYGATETASILARSNEMRLGNSQSNMTFYASSSERMRIHSNGNVGIGTTSPGYKLTVAGDAGFSDWIYASKFYPTSSTTDILMQTGAGRTITLDPTSTGKVLMPNGNVGIGTTSPSTKLDVRGDITITNANGGNPTDAGSLYFTEAAGVWGSTQYGFRINQQGASNYLNFQSANTTTVRDILTLARDTGNVGIGTTAPGYNLHIADADATINLAKTDGDQYLRLVGGSGTNSDVIAQRTLTLQALSGNVLLQPTGNVGIGAASPNAKLTLRGSGLISQDFFHIEDSGGVRMLEVTSDPAGNANLQVKDTTGVTKSLINSAGNSYFNGGNIGIGTTSPAKKLEVNGTVHLGSGGNDVTIGASNSSVIYMMRAGYNYIQASDASGAIMFRTGGANNRMIIDSSGNVGIGTTSPTGILDVLSTDAQRYARFRAPNGEERFQFYIGSTGNSSVLNMFQSDGTTQGVKMSSQGTSYFNGGNVGIGTTTITEKLTVEGNILLQASGGGNSKTRLIPSEAGGNSALTVKGGNFNHNVYFDTSWNDFQYARLKASYNTSDSYFELNKSATDASVDGTTRISTGDSYFNGKVLLNNTTNNSFDSIVNLTLNADSDSNSGDSFRNIIFQNRGVETARIDSDGNVGIGNTSPAAAVDIVRTSLPTTGTDYGVLVDMEKASSTTSYDTDLYGLRSYVRATSTGSNQITNLNGLWSKAEHTGTGNTYYILGSSNRGYHNGSGNTGAMYGAFNETRITGTGTSSHNYVIGTSTIADLQAANASVNYLQSAHVTTKMSAGTVDNNLMAMILDLDVTGGTVSGDLEYLRIQNDTIGATVNGTSRAINSESTLPSRFAGDMHFESNVGIGTTNLNSRLTIKGGGNVSQSFLGIQDSDGTTMMRVDSDSSGNAFLTVRSTVGIQTALINSSGNSYLNGGNVGIGTSSPSYKLDVNGTARVQGRLTIPGSIVHEGDIGTSIGFSSNDTIALSTNGSTKLEINAFGQTAITGSLRVGTDVFNSLSISSGLLGTTYTTNANGLNSQPDISFRTGSTTRLKINGVNGNVGIGTTSPAAKLQILDNAEQPQLRVGTDASNYLDIKAGSLSTSFTATGSGFVSPDINFNTNGTKLSIKGLTGFVGIGSGTPSEMLEVFGNVQAETLIATDLTDGYVPWSRNGTLGLQDSEIYQDNGQVGIGTTTLSQALNVDGDILADGYRVTGMQTAPSGKGDTGTLGEIRITQNYIYVCYATNSWSRVALETSW